MHKNGEYAHFPGEKTGIEQNKGEVCRIVEKMHTFQGEKTEDRAKQGGKCAELSRKCTLFRGGFKIEKRDRIW